MSQQPEEKAGSAGAAEADELQGYGNDTGFAVEAEQADTGASADEQSDDTEGGAPVTDGA